MPPRRRHAPALVVGIVAALLTTVALAQSGPSIRSYAVTGVAADDTLSLRADIDGASSVSDAPVIARIPSNATDLQATGRTMMLNGSEWRELRFGGVVGWAAARFLAASGEPDFDILATQAVACAGTEPFWGLDLAGSDARFTSPESEAYYAVVDRRAPAQNRNRWAVDLVAKGSGERATAVLLTETICSDGMSDVLFPMEILWLSGKPGTRPLSGCCSLSWR